MAVDQSWTNEELQEHALESLIDEEEEELLLLENPDVAEEMHFQSLVDTPYDLGEVKINRLRRPDWEDD